MCSLVNLLRYAVVFLSMWFASLQPALGQSGEEIFSLGDFQLLSVDPNLGSAVRRESLIEVRVTGLPKNPWDVQIQSPPIPRAVKAGDVLCLDFAGSLSSNVAAEAGELSIYFQDCRTYEAANQKDATHVVSPTNQPISDRIFVRCDRDFESGTLNVSIHAASKLQTIHIHDLRLSYLGNVPDEQLPVVKLRYPKNDQDIEVLKRAVNRIERVRKADLTVLVVDQNSNPIRDARVRVKQLRHAFAFGSFTDSQPLVLSDPNTQKYRDMMKQLFNRVTLPRYFADWGTDTLEGKQQADDMMRWAASEGFELKTHLLLYPGFLPKRVLALQNQPAAFRQELENAMDDALRRTANTPMVAWDGLNELRDSDVIGEVLGQNYYAHIFNNANATQPAPRWFINEYGIIAGHVKQDQNIADYERKIQQILDDGGAIEGIGMQGHFQDRLTSMSKAEEVLDRFAKFQLPIEITEFDIETRDESTQAEYTEDFVTLVFSHPSTTGFTLWGFWEGSMWRPSGAMYRKDWSIKPNGKVWNSLVFDRWWTKEEANTDEQGLVSIRAFHGMHQITVEYKGSTITQNVVVPPAGQRLEIKWQ